MHKKGDDLLTTENYSQSATNYSYSRLLPARETSHLTHFKHAETKINSPRTFLHSITLTTCRPINKWAIYNLFKRRRRRKKKNMATEEADQEPNTHLIHTHEHWAEEEEGEKKELPFFRFLLFHFFSLASSLSLSPSRCHRRSRSTVVVVVFLFAF